MNYLYADLKEDVPPHLVEVYEARASSYWDIFYDSNRDKFYKDRWVPLRAREQAWRTASLSLRHHTWVARIGDTSAKGAFVSQKLIYHDPVSQALPG